jgi:hypothetical protein
MISHRKARETLVELYGGKRARTNSWGRNNAPLEILRDDYEAFNTCKFLEKIGVAVRVEDGLCKISPPGSCNDKLETVYQFDTVRGMRLREALMIFDEHLERRKAANANKPPIVQLSQAAGNLAEPVIDGLLRRTEVGNLVAAPKTGKSWAALILAMAVATGSKWFGFQCTPGRVLIIDNELAPDVLEFRRLKVAEMLGLNPVDVKAKIDVWALRGNLKNINEIDKALRENWGHSLIIVDSLYRALPPGTDENSNSDVTQIYNTLDGMALRLNAALVCVHHTSKGIQGGKSVTDVGSGAGAQSRAVDCHITLRPHEEAGVIVMDSVVRSFPPPAPSTWRWEWPLFYPVDLDPTALKREGKRKAKETATTKETAPTPAEFAAHCLTPDPQEIAIINMKAKNVFGLSARAVKELLSIGVLQGEVIKSGGKPGIPTTYSTPLPLTRTPPTPPVGA